MRISVVADVHGNLDGLARVAETCERLVILGDLLDYVDYHEPAAGIMGTVFGADHVRHFTRLRSAGRFAALHEFNARLWASLADPVGELSGIVRARYRRVVEVVGDDTLVILGNVDVVDEWDAVAGDALPRRDGAVVDIDGVRFGFVAGGVRRGPRPLHDVAAAAEQRSVAVRPPWRPFIRSAGEFRAVLDSLGPVDVLGSHVPPEIAPLRYDVIPARLEMAGPGLTDYIDRFRPALSLFGHVHQPLANRVRRGMTECRNVGHFQRFGEPLVIETEHVRATRSAREAARRRVDR